MSDGDPRTQEAPVWCPLADGCCGAPALGRKACSEGRCEAIFDQGFIGFAQWYFHQIHGPQGDEEESDEEESKREGFYQEVKRRISAARVRVAPVDLEDDVAQSLIRVAATEFFQQEKLAHISEQWGLINEARRQIDADHALMMPRHRISVGRANWAVFSGFVVALVLGHFTMDATSGFATLVWGTGLGAWCLGPFLNAIQVWGWALTRKQIVDEQ